MGGNKRGVICMYRQKLIFIINLFMVIILIIGLFYVFYLFWWITSGNYWFQRHKSFIDKVERLLSKSEKEVIKTLGKPHYIIYAHDLKNNIMRKYPTLKGYARPNKPITNKALIYIKGDAIFYIYINHEGFVEYVFYGPS